jgi:hypothetical protein
VALNGERFVYYYGAVMRTWGDGSGKPRKNSNMPPGSRGDPVRAAGRVFTVVVSGLASEQCSNTSNLHI